MEVLGAVSSVAGIVESVNGIILWLQESTKADKGLAAEASRVQAICEQTRALLKCNEAACIPKEVADPAMAKVQNVESIRKKYQHHCQWSHKLNRLRRALPNLEDLRQIEIEMQGVQVLLNTVVTVKLPADIQENHREVMDGLRDIRQVAGKDATIADAWKFSDTTVPSRREFMLGVEDLSTIRELKRTVLRRKSSSVAVISIRGSGGVGKTTACIVIANDVDVRRYFEDAILWIQLGDNASAVTVVTQIAAIVKATGGHAAAREIMKQGEKHLDEVLNKAREWFSGKSIVLVVDNISATSVRRVAGGNWMSILQRIPSGSSCILFSTKSLEMAKLSEESVQFEPLKSDEDQRKMFLAHLGRRSKALEISDNDRFQRVRDICGGVPLALATVGSYLKSDGLNLSSALHDMEESFLEEKQQNQVILGGHPGLLSIYGAVLKRLDNDHQFRRDNAVQVLLEANLEYCWTDRYTSLSVLEKSSPRAPIYVLSELWGFGIEFTELVCKCFVNVGLGELKPAEHISDREFRLHDLQWNYCSTQSRHSSSFGKPVSFWNERLLDGLVTAAGVSNPTVLSPEASPPNSSSPRSAAYVQAFCAIDTAIEEYWIGKFVHHICGVEGGITTAKEVVTDYRWVRRVAERCDPVGVARGIDQILEANGALQAELHETESSAGVSSVESQYSGAISEQDVKELAEIAHVFRNEIPPDAAHPREEGVKCFPHPAESNGGDSGLAHRIIGRLGCPDEGDRTMERAKHRHLAAKVGGVISTLIESVEKHAGLPWLRPVNRCFTGVDDGRIIHVQNASIIAVFCPGSKEIVAVGCEDGAVHLHELERGDSLGTFTEDGVEEVTAIAVATERGATAQTDKERLVGIRFAVVDKGGTVRVWDVAAQRLVSRLQTSTKRSLRNIALASDCSRVVSSDFQGTLHIWDLSSDGAQVGYEQVEGCQSPVSFEVASTVLVHDATRPVAECGNDIVQFESEESAEDGNPIRSVRLMHKFISNASEQWMECSRVHSDTADRELLFVSNTTERSITALDVHTGEQIGESHPDKWLGEDVTIGPIFLHDSHTYVIFKTRSAPGSEICVCDVESGELTGQKQIPWNVRNVKVDCLGRRIVAICEAGVLSCPWTGRDDSATQPRAVNPRRAHKWGVSRIGISSNGLWAVSCTTFANSFLVWDTATGQACHQIDRAGRTPHSPETLAVSDDGQWVLCVGVVAESEPRELLVYVCRDAKTSYSTTFQPRTEECWEEWFATIETDPEHCAVVITDMDSGSKETHEWAISSAGLTKVKVGVMSESLANSADRQEIVCLHKANRLDAYRGFRDVETQCTCKATALFDAEVATTSIWSGQSLQQSRVGPAETIVAVGLEDGTVHFAELHG
jgi:WD40 repeat protein